MKITYLSTPPATGKTTVLLHHTAHIVRRAGHVLFISPTIELAEQSYKNFRNDHSDCRATLIHSKQGDTPCAGRIAAKMRDPLNDGEALFIVFASFCLISDDEYKGAWTAIVDEIPALTKETSKNLTDTYMLLTDCLEAHAVGPHYSQLSLTDEEKISAYHRNKSGDDVVDVIREIASLLTSPYWDNHVVTEQYINLIVENNEE